MALSITIKNRDIQHYDTQNKSAPYCRAECLCWLSFMLNVITKPTMLTVVMLSYVMLNGILLSDVAPIRSTAFSLQLINWPNKLECLYLASSFIK